MNLSGIFPTKLLSRPDKRGRLLKRHGVLTLRRVSFRKPFPHLKTVPKWQQYLLCGDSVPMAVILKAKEKGLFLEGVDYPVPAAVLLCEKQQWVMDELH